jgi:hypothetical protein
VGGQAIDYVSKAIPDHDHARVQVWVWSKARLQASQIARQARAAIIGSALAAQTYGAPVSEHLEELKLYGSRTDFGVWYQP